MNPGFVYILTNKAMPGLVKIGRTSRDVDIRASELWQTGVPERFEVFWSFKTPDCVQLEAYLHGALRENRVSMAREFFNIDPDEARDQGRFWAGLQAKEWMNEFFSEYTAVSFAESAASAAVDRIAAETGNSELVVAEAMARLTASDLAGRISEVRSERETEHQKLLAEIGVPEDERWGCFDE